MLLTKTLRIGASTAVEREEDILEIGLVAVEADDLEARKRLDESVGRPLQGERDDVAVPPGLRHAGNGSRRHPPAAWP